MASLLAVASVTVIWASPSHITLAIWVRVRVTGDTHITRFLGMGLSISLLHPSLKKPPDTQANRGDDI